VPPDATAQKWRNFNRFPVRIGPFRVKTDRVRPVQNRHDTSWSRHLSQKPRFDIRLFNSQRAAVTEVALNYASGALRDRAPRGERVAERFACKSLSG
jgi:hypothetical protein